MKERLEGGPTCFVFSVCANFFRRCLYYPTFCLHASSLAFVQIGAFQGRCALILVCTLNVIIVFSLHNNEPFSGSISPGAFRCVPMLKQRILFYLPLVSFIRLLVVVVVEPK